MKKIVSLFLAFALAVPCFYACSNEKDDPINQPDEPNNPEEENELTINYELIDIDIDNYIYPEADATVNPNIVDFDEEKDVVVSIDTVEHKAVLQWDGEMPKLYRGAIVPVIYEEKVYTMFVMAVRIEGKTATIEYRDAGIWELFFNQTLKVGDAPQTKSTDRDYDSSFKKAFNLYQMVESGLKFEQEKTDLDFRSENEFEFGEVEIIKGKNIYSPFKRMKFVLVGEVDAKARVSFTPTFSASVSKCKDLKQSAFRTWKIFTVTGVPVCIDFNIDICGDINVKTSIERAFRYSQQLGATLTARIGAEYNFETKKLTPLNSLTMTPQKNKPEMSSLDENLSIEFDASVFPRIKIYFYKLKIVGMGSDLKPVFARVQAKTCKKEGHIFFNTTYSLGTSVKGFIYLWDWEKECNHYLAETGTYENVWWTYKSPGKIEDKTADVKERTNYGGRSQSTFNVMDLAYEWDQQTLTPAAAQEMSIELEKMCTLPDPEINPEVFQESPKSTKAGVSGWYSWGKEYHYLDADGNVTVPFDINAPAGWNFKLVARILDGDGNPVMEVEHPTYSGIKSYVATQHMTGEGCSGDFNITVKDWGAYVREQGTMVTSDGVVKIDSEFKDGKISGTLVAGGVSMPSSIFIGPGTYHAKLVPDGLFSISKTMGEGLDFQRWAHDRLDYSLEGATYHEKEWNGYKATVCYMPDGGVFTYIGNFMVELQSEGISFTTTHFSVTELD